MSRCSMSTVVIGDESGLPGSFSLPNQHVQFRVSVSSAWGAALERREQLADPLDSRDRKVDLAGLVADPRAIQRCKANARESTLCQVGTDLAVRPRSPPQKPVERAPVTISSTTIAAAISLYQTKIE